MVIIYSQFIANHNNSFDNGIASLLRTALHIPSHLHKWESTPLSLNFYLLYNTNINFPKRIFLNPDAGSQTEGPSANAGNRAICRKSIVVLNLSSNHLLHFRCCRFSLLPRLFHLPTESLFFCICFCSYIYSGIRILGRRWRFFYTRSFFSPIFLHSLRPCLALSLSLRPISSSAD